MKPREHCGMENVITWPAPASEPASPDYTIEAGGRPVFVYQARVRAEILQKEGLWSHRPDCQGQRASFGIFDMTGPVTVVVRPARPFRTAALLPARAGITPEIGDDRVRFTLDRPRHLTLLLDGDDSQALHLFVGAPETDAPRLGDPNVIYFGPGVHEIQTLDLHSGQTVYLAGGAIVKATLRPGEAGTYSEQWKATFYHGSVLNLRQVSSVRVCGRGILDGSLVPHPGRNLIGVHESTDIRLEGIVLRDSPNWNVILQKSQHVRVEDLRLVSGRLNSDGINSVNSRDVVIRRCFVRNHDDSIVVKTTEPGTPAEDIEVADCVIWSDWGYALGATYETRAPIRRVSFRRCDIVYCRHWCMGVHVSDGATVSAILFDDIEIADMTRAPHRGGAYDGMTAEPELLRMVITQDVWGHDTERGRIRDVRVQNVTVHGSRMLSSELLGLDAEHDIRNVVLRDVRIANERYAQVGMRISATIRVEDPPAGVNLEDGRLDEYPDPAHLTDEEKALFNGLATESTDDVDLLPRK